jgi:nitric-oxide synthase
MLQQCPAERHVRASAPNDSVANGPIGNDPTDAANTAASLPEVAEDFIRLVHDENPALGPAGPRVDDVLGEIARTGTYAHTSTELEHGARVAWRNAARCIGRLYWRSLIVRDRRAVSGASEIAEECAEHLRVATNGGRVRPVVTIFPAAGPDGVGPRIWNDQLVRYAGYTSPAGAVVGDPAQAAFTEAAQLLGWNGGAGTPFDVLPLVVDTPTEAPALADVPSDAVLEVAITHPTLPWFADLGLWWHAVPAIANMPLEIGGVVYTAAPFNGWYMGTEIGARNFADTDRYDLLPVVAERMGLDVTTNRSLWKDRALVELNVAVLHSFDAAGVTLSDHHTESERFLTHIAREESAGRPCPADWSWIVPPVSGGVTPVFHRYYDESELRPQFLPTRSFDVVAAARRQPVISVP